MGPDTAELHLSRIQTFWTVICQAHEGPAGEAQAAQQQLLQRYGKAVKRYLLGALRDSEAADELAQEFAFRFLKGDFRRADPERGRFRDFVKGVLFHLIADHHRLKQRQPRPLPDAVEPAAPEGESAEADRQFLESWRAELLDRAWRALADLQSQTGQPIYTVLRLRAERIELRSAQMAEVLGEQLGKRVTAAWVRQTLHRARDKFAELLVDEVVQTVKAPSQEETERELIELGLLEYCKPALQQFGREV